MYTPSQLWVMVAVLLIAKALSALLGIILLLAYQLWRLCAGMLSIYMCKSSSNLIEIQVSTLCTVCERSVSLSKLVIFHLPSLLYPSPLPLPLSPCLSSFFPPLPTLPVCVPLCVTLQKLLNVKKLESLGGTVIHSGTRGTCCYKSSEK